MKNLSLNQIAKRLQYERRLLLGKIEKESNKPEKTYFSKGRNNKLIAKMSAVSSLILELQRLALSLKSLQAEAKRAGGKKLSFIKGQITEAKGRISVIREEVSI